MAGRITLVVARAANGIIGSKGGLPWHLSEDLKHFKRLTVGKPVLMGRKTFESIGKPLPGRHNIVVTRQADWRADGVTTAANLAEAIVAAGLDPRTRAPEIMIIGGGEIYVQALPLAQTVHLTEVHAEVDGDTRFPALDPEHWQETARLDHPAAGGQPAFSFVTLERI